MRHEIKTTEGVEPAVCAFDDPLGRLDAVGTIDLLDGGELSIAEVVEAAIARARSIDPLLGAVAFERFDAARGTLPSHRRRRGGLDGVPTFIKDMVHVAGLPSSWGSEALAGGPSHRRTGGIAAHIEAAGMVVIGTSTMPEWGFAPSTEFSYREPTRNPWNVDRTIGGSSGGSAALVAAGVVPIAHAADGGGSIRIPAACAGLVGLKPSRGRLRPDPSQEALPVTIVCDGVVTRTVRDTARWYAELERVFLNRKLPPMGEVAGPPTRRLRIGVLSAFPGFASIDAPTRATLDATAAALTDLGHHVDEAMPPVDPEQFRDDFVAYYEFLAFMATRTARVSHGSHVRPDLYTPFTNGMAASFRPAARRFPAAVRRLRQARSKVAEFHRTWDLLLTPTTATVAPALGHLGATVEHPVLLQRIVDWIPFTPLANAAGTPAISLPMGFDPETNLPVGAMLSADFGEDALLVQVALELEAARPWAS